MIVNIILGISYTFGMMYFICFIYALLEPIFKAIYKGVNHDARMH